MTSLANTQKTCTKCGETKPLTSFYKNRTAKDGRHSHCAECQKAAIRRYQAARRAEVGDEAWLKQNREARRRNYRNDPEGNRLQSQAIQIAMTTLRDNHRAEYEALIRQARYDLGLPV